ncbi:MAG: hypothetical protein JKY32_12280 [Rhizobiales bacterium]|nr:hypothetical protein [Hyphomicrobiales bacterium]
MQSRRSKYNLPEKFPEEDFLRGGTMRHEIIVMAVEAANKQGYPDVDDQSIWSNKEHRELMLDYLRDCRPLPVILELIAEFESGKPAATN